MVMKTTRQTHRRWCVSNGSQTLQRGQLGRLCLPDAVLLGHWDIRVSFATNEECEEKVERKKKRNFSMKL